MMTLPSTLRQPQGPPPENQDDEVDELLVFLGSPADPKLTRLQNRHRR